MWRETRRQCPCAIFRPPRTLSSPSFCLYVNREVLSNLSPAFALRFAQEIADFSTIVEISTLLEVEVHDLDHGTAQGPTPLQHLRKGWFGIGPVQGSFSVATRRVLRKYLTRILIYSELPLFFAQIFFGGLEHITHSLSHCLRLLSYLSSNLIPWQHPHNRTTSLLSTPNKLSTTAPPWATRVLEKEDSL